MIIENDPIDGEDQFQKRLRSSFVPFVDEEISFVEGCFKVKKVRWVFTLDPNERYVKLTVDRIRGW